MLVSLAKIWQGDEHEQEDAHTDAGQQKLRIADIELADGRTESQATSEIKVGEMTQSRWRKR